VVASSNEEAVRPVARVVDQFRASSGTHLLSGVAGTGKTHLMRAMAAEARRRWPEALIESTSVKVLIEEAATDTDWSTGTANAEVHGTAGDLLMIATGRTAGLSGLTGPGVQTLATQLQAN